MSAKTVADNLKSGVIDIAEMLGQWEDIVKTADGLETRFNEGLNYLEFHMEDIKASISAILTDLGLKLQNPTFLTDITAHLNGLLPKLPANLSADISIPADPNILRLIKDNLNIDLPDTGLPALVEQIKGILEMFAMPGVDLAIVNTGADVEGDPVDLGSTLAESQQTAANDLFTRIEAAISQMDVIPDIEGYIQEYRDLLTPDPETGAIGPISPQLLMTSMVTMMQSIAAKSIPAVQEMVNIVFEQLPNIMPVIKDLLNNSLPEDISEFLEHMAGSEGRQPSLIRLSALATAVPLTIFHKEAGDEPLSFPPAMTFTREDFRTSKTGYGLCQIFGAATMAADIWTSDINEKNKTKKIKWALKANIPAFLSIFLNSMAQATSFTDHALGKKGAEYDLPTGIWRYQWFMCVAWPLLMWLLDIVKCPAIPQINAASTLIWESIHLLLFGILLDGERKKGLNNDSRIQACYIIDPMPAILDLLLSRAQEYYTSRIESLLHGIINDILEAFECRLIQLGQPVVKGIAEAVEKKADDPIIDKFSELGSYVSDAFDLLEEEHGMKFTPALTNLNNCIGDLRNVITENGVEQQFEIYIAGIESDRDKISEPLKKIAKGAKFDRRNKYKTLRVFLAIGLKATYGGLYLDTAIHPPPEVSPIQGDAKENQKIFTHVGGKGKYQSPVGDHIQWQSSSDGENWDNIGPWEAREKTDGYTRKGYAYHLTADDCLKRIRVKVVYGPTFSEDERSHVIKNLPYLEIEPQNAEVDTELTVKIVDDGESEAEGCTVNYQWYKFSDVGNNWIHLDTQDNKKTYTPDAVAKIRITAVISYNATNALKIYKEFQVAA